MHFTSNMENACHVIDFMRFYLFFIINKCMKSMFVKKQTTVI